MQLLIVRHAPAEEPTDLHASDHVRPLTSKGRKLFREFTQRFLKPDMAPSLILHSPLVRTTQTAEILQEVLALPKGSIHVEPRVGPGMSLSQVIQVVQGTGAERVAIVAHNPDVGYWTSQLIGGGSIEFKKGSMASIEFDSGIAPGIGRLNWFISPKVIVND